MGKLIRDDSGFEFDGLGGEMRMTPSSARAAAGLLRKLDRFMAKVTDCSMYSVYISIVPFFNPAPRTRHGVSAMDAGGAYMISVDRIGCAFLSFHQYPISFDTLDKYFPGFRPQFGDNFSKLFCSFINNIGKYLQQDKTYNESLQELLATADSPKSASIGFSGSYN